MHPEAKKALRKKVLHTLKQCVVRERLWVVEVPEDSWQSYADDVEKHRARWMSRSDAFLVLYTKANDWLTRARDSGPIQPGPLETIVGAPAVFQLASEIANYVESVPRKVDVYFPLNTAPDGFADSIYLSDTASIITCSAADNPLYVPNQLQGEATETESVPRKAYLKISVGCCPSYMRDSNFMRDALLLCKCYLQFGISQSLLKTSDDSLSGGYLRPRVYSSPIVKIYSNDRNPNPLPFNDIDLSFELSRFFSRLRIATESPAIQAVQRGEDIDAETSRQLLKAVALVDSDDEGAERIRAAAHWSIDSRVTDNHTMAFIQVCIGFESIFGEGTENGKVTEILADRCAYVLAPKISLRKKVKENFKLLYKVRSKLVHGNALELSSAERHILEWGRKALDIAISIECEKLGGSAT